MKGRKFQFFTYTYHQFWKKKYPNLRASTPSEDIYKLCYRFANHSKFRLNDRDLHHSSLEFPNDDTKREWPREGDEEEEQLERESVTKKMICVTRWRSC